MSDVDGHRRVGFIGLGQMGRPMARRLVAAGFDVHGFDAIEQVRTAAADDGVRVAGTVEQVARTCPVTILMLPNSDVVDAVAGRIAAVDRPADGCRTLIDMSSSEPARTRLLSDRLEPSGIKLIDAPVSGGVSAAQAGTLTVMVGGSAEQFRAVAAWLAPIGKSVVQVGPVGAGHALKALNNLMSACSMLITAEAMTIATKFGIEPSTALEVVNSASGRSGSTEAKFPRFVLPGTFDSGFTAALMDKDVAIATGLGRALSVDTPLAEAVAARWHELTGQLRPGADHTEVVRPLEAKHGLEIRSHANG
ncbi:2-hydroxy-3-oxopropionate reductase [Amycolatopsis deserti]|uniref:2-hydroxy-3-oxopropionate reductase n=1 Tax=Amycolatopsis deserti TaxID=185696 RepID=A0ABQ3IF45_9PSEU|nr:NAD(P)-dependent oxidoreductase [Amycolatopsis deserti]GHE80772.1 2-hydroxy-3-oxopropionate reductase [Amycolatopsis deserti]